MSTRGVSEAKAAHRVLALDVGKTGSRAALYVGSRRVAEGESTGASGLANRDGVAEAMSAIERTSAKIGFPLGTYGEGDQAIKSVAVGLAGAARAHDKALVLAELLSRRSGITDVSVASDMTTSHLGALDGASGVVVAAGTGAVALGVGRSGRTAAVDGWGYLIGDAGSGYAIARCALDRALRAHDGRGGSPDFARLAEKRYGALNELAASVYGDANPARIIAAFARDLADAANGGHAESIELWAEAGRELARTAIAAASRAEINSAAIVTTGGLFDVGDILQVPFSNELMRLAPTTCRLERNGDALYGAMLMAVRADLPHESLVTRTRGRTDHQTGVQNE